VLPRITFVLSNVLCVALVACGATTLPAGAQSALLGKGLPDFQRASLRGERIDTGGLRGKTIVVKFFAEYCEPCKRTLPAAERLHRRYPEVAFIGVSEDEYVASAEAVGQTYGLSFPIVHDRGRALQGRFRVSELPVTFVADERGTVRWVGGPAQNEGDLEQALEALEP